VHRPGAELKRVVPRTGRQLPFAGLPWVARSRNMTSSPRQQAIGAALGSAMLGDELAGQVQRHLEGLDPETFAGTKSLYRPGLEPLHGGDLLLAAPGVIAAGCPPPGVERLAPGLVVSHERNVATHTRLDRVGIDVITVPGSELCGSRGGPRSLCCPVSRDPAPARRRLIHRTLRMRSA
jgi:hypothetical protein